MMQRILLSLAIVAAVGGGAVASTGAFFSDSETSTGNVFTAGAIDLKVDSTAHYDGLVCTAQGWALDQGATNPSATTTRPELIGQDCDGTWELTDLKNGVHKFFNFADVKPGDEGENTISLHLDNNPAWACIDVNITKNDDVSSTEPELEAGDATNTDSIFDGELAQNVKFAAWLDTDGDNVWDQGEQLLFSNKTGPASDVLGGKTYTLADSTTGAPLPANITNYIGLAWCAGTQTVDVGANTITCDGAGMGNDAQTDTMTADIAFRVEQSRNNTSFTCAGTSPIPPQNHSLRLENETIVADGPWIVINDGTYADLTWTGDGDTFNYSLTGQGLAANTDYDLIYYADGWPGNNPGAYIGHAITDGSGNISLSDNVDLGIDLPTMPDGNYAVGAKIWLVLRSDYNGGTLATGPMTAWNPSQYLFEGNVYIHYNDTNN